MIWGEQGLRDVMKRRAIGGIEVDPLMTVQTVALSETLDELDRLRDYLRRIRLIADDKVQQQLPGWGAWSTVQRLVREGLGE